jgi:ABC-type branched-subunit amino acid transport system permease subunit
MSWSTRSPTRTRRRTASCDPFPASAMATEQPILTPGAEAPPRRALRVPSRRVIELVALGLLVVAPLVLGDGFAIDRLGRYLLLAVFAMTVDVVWGYGGMFTFGHAAFFGGAAYVVAMLTTQEYWVLPLPLWPAVAIGVLAAAVLAWAIGAFTFSGRFALRGVEFAVVTLAVSFLLERLMNAGGSVTGGQNGILFDVRLEIGPLDLQRRLPFYLLAAVILVSAYLGLRNFVTGRTGLVNLGIREDEDRVALLGYRVPAVKRGVLVLSAALAGLCGALYYVHEGIVSPAAVGVDASTLVLLWVVLGGRGTLIGPVVGAVVLNMLTASLSGTLLGTWLVVVGVVLVAVILFFPNGLFGFLSGPEGRR